MQWRNLHVGGIGLIGICAVCEELERGAGLGRNWEVVAGDLSSLMRSRGTEERRHDEMGHLKTKKTRYREGSHLFMVSATAGTSARRTMFSRPRYLMLGSRTLMNLPSIATPAPSVKAEYFSQVFTCPLPLDQTKDGDVL